MTCRTARGRRSLAPREGPPHRRLAPLPRASPRAGEMDIRAAVRRRRPGRRGLSVECRPSIRPSSESDQPRCSASAGLQRQCDDQPARSGARTGLRPSRRAPRARCASPARSAPSGTARELGRALGFASTSEAWNACLMGMSTSITPFPRAHQPGRGQVSATRSRRLAMSTTSSSGPELSDRRAVERQSQITRGRRVRHGARVDACR
jgi:hypothetical protein